MRPDPVKKMSVEFQVKYRYTTSQDSEERHLQELVKFLAKQQGKVTPDKNHTQHDRSTVLSRQ